MVDGSKIFSSGISQETDALHAVEDLALKVKGDLKGRSCDAAILFVSEDYRQDHPEYLVGAFRDLTAANLLIGCNACGVICNHEEIEKAPAIGVLAMHLPDVKFYPFTFTDFEIGTIQSSANFMDYLDLYPSDHPKFLCFANPMNCDVMKLLRLFNETYPGCPVSGGLASANVLGVPNWLCLNEDICLEGAVGVGFGGDISFEMIVSQGCRPVGEPWVITKAEGNILLELANQPALHILHGVINKLPPAEQALAERSIFIGIARDELSVRMQKGDFLIRNIIGADEHSGALAVGEILESGQTVQFHLRDAKASREDLQARLKQCPRSEPSRNEGALLANCLGRGRTLYDAPHHDAQIIQSVRGPLPLTGFFSNGEFGLIGKTNYLHGYTSSLTLIY
ncbi:MAG: FIST C-terminal domain-containing protein [Candidatus Omnitrophica bacterium]|nr:FIST C-terminal domain-containing protein [Candidatus Omnitrophota bacterium]